MGALTLMRQLVFQCEVPGSDQKIDARAIEIYRRAHKERRSWSQLTHRRKMHNQPKRRVRQWEFYADYEITDETGLLRMMKSEIDSSEQVKEVAADEEAGESDDSETKKRQMLKKKKK